MCMSKKISEIEEKVDVWFIIIWFLTLIFSLPFSLRFSPIVFSIIFTIISFIAVMVFVMFFREPIVMVMKQREVNSLQDNM
jgi:hypothetical protein